MPKPGEADHHQLRVGRVQHLPADAEVIRHVGRVVLQEHVRLGDQLQGQAAPAFAGQVERGRQVAPLGVVENHHPVPEALRAVAVEVADAPEALHNDVGDVPQLGARRVEMLDRLDLDDLSAQVRQDHRAERASPHQALRQDPDTSERRFAVIHPACSFEA